MYKKPKPETMKAKDLHPTIMQDDNAFANLPKEVSELSDQDLDAVSGGALQGNSTGDRREQEADRVAAQIVARIATPGSGKFLRRRGRLL